MGTAGLIPAGSRLGRRSPLTSCASAVLYDAHRTTGLRRRDIGRDDDGDCREDPPPMAGARSTRCSNPSSGTAGEAARRPFPVSTRPGLSTQGHLAHIIGLRLVGRAHRHSARPGHPRRMDCPATAVATTLTLAFTTFCSDDKAPSVACHALSANDLPRGVVDSTASRLPATSCTALAGTAARRRSTPSRAAWQIRLST